ncbi:tyrosine-type recombinase/integrase [Pseudodesulfovibrio sp. JC047]|uniref:tyrosine-type recombinase/integrase n=1 Tax=Pseudodesulfovibrio sp. JC047 TaxID=2683199 RepID=UPI0013D54C1F|nr:site-specific integrase [Pseudodesulfovibrio sp. JC047]NDV20567.1 tyrosine-type recombinase/integrase [Pseudodesulfovibrio sp. JC047]
MTKIRVVSLHTLMTKHLFALKAKGVAQGTYDDKTLVFKELLDWPGVSAAMEVNMLQHDVMRQFLDHIAETRSGRRANTFRKHIMRLWNWGKRSRIIQGECPWDVEPYKCDRSEKYVPPEEDFWAVYEVADVMPTAYGKSVTQAHRKRMMLAYLHTAARRSEIFNLKWEDVDFKNERIRLFTKKRTSGREGNWIPLTEQLAAVLKEQRLETGFREHVFINPRTDKPYAYGNNMVRKMCEMAMVKPFGFHSIRHLSASILAKAGVDLPTIQLILRHTSVTTTARYVHSLIDATEAMNGALGGKVLDMKKASSE